MTTTASSPVGALPVEAIRSRFPALERVHNGLPVAYFDGPGGTQVPRDVVDAVADYLLHHNANTHWAYPTSVETDAALAAARAALADFLGGTPSEVAFGASDTLIAFNRFAAPIPGVRWPIMILYWLGQSGIAASAVLGCGMLRAQVKTR